MKSEIVLHHSTDQQSLDLINASDRLFGMEALVRSRSGPMTMSNLTPDKAASQDFVIEYRVRKKRGEIDVLPKLLTLTFCFPTEMVRVVGTTHIYACIEYATNLTIAAEILPDAYLSQIHAGMSPMTREQAISFERSRQARFYEAPLKYLLDVEKINY